MLSYFWFMRPEAVAVCTDRLFTLRSCRVDGGVCPCGLGKNVKNSDIHLVVVANKKVAKNQYCIALDRL